VKYEILRTLKPILASLVLEQTSGSTADLMTRKMGIPLFNDLYVNHVELQTATIRESKNAK
jgi:hypothetical protein